MLMCLKNPYLNPVSKACHVCRESFYFAYNHDKGIIQGTEIKKKTMYLNSSLNQVCLPWQWKKKTSIKKSIKIQ